ncbi:hypothetical protein HED48_23500 [Ochrobactrum intermedium]|nr:hypothetical protein [Brucella intermedia]
MELTKVVKLMQNAACPVCAGKICFSPKRSNPMTDTPIDFIAEAITDSLGPRCPEHSDGCPSCEAWAQYDRLKAIAALYDHTKPPVVMVPDDATAEEILKSTIDHPNAVVMLKRLPDARAAALEEAARNAAMYLATGFITCPRCGEEVETKNTDAEYALRAALSSPDHADAGKVEGMRELILNVSGVRFPRPTGQSLTRIPSTSATASR